jgi:hypothetical protein
MHELFAECEANEACNAAYPGLEETTRKIITDFNASPALLTFDDPRGGQPFDVTVTGDTLLLQIYAAMYGDLAHQLPVLAAMLAEGDAEIAFSADRFLPGGESTFSHGLNVVAAPTHPPRPRHST